MSGLLDGSVTGRQVSYDAYRPLHCGALEHAKGRTKRKWGHAVAVLRERGFMGASMRSAFGGRQVCSGGCRMQCFLRSSLGQRVVTIVRPAAAAATSFCGLCRERGSNLDKGQSGRTLYCETVSGAALGPGPGRRTPRPRRRPARRGSPAPGGHTTRVNPCCGTLIARNTRLWDARRRLAIPAVAVRYLAQPRALEHYSPRVLVFGYCSLAAAAAPRPRRPRPFVSFGDGRGR